MPIQYIIAGGQLQFDKLVFTRELLLPDSPFKKILRANGVGAQKQPKVIKEDNLVTIDFNEASDIILDEAFYDLFKKLKEKYRDKITGRVVIRITALTSYHVIINLHGSEGKIVYE